MWAVWNDVFSVLSVYVSDTLWPLNKVKVIKPSMIRRKYPKQDLLIGLMQSLKDHAESVEGGGGGGMQSRFV